MAVSWEGMVTDLNIVIKRLGRLKRFISNNEVSKYKALSTDVLDNLSDLDVIIQASTDAQDLGDTPTLDLRDNPYQTTD